MSIRLGLLAHELSILTTNAMLAVAAIKKGNVGVAGATGAGLDRSLLRLRALVDRALVEKSRWRRPSRPTPKVSSSP